MLLVDSNDLSRFLIRSLLYKSSAVEMIGEATCFRDALALVRRFLPDTVIVGDDMPKDEDAYFRSALHDEFPKTKIVDSGALDRAALQSNGQAIDDSISRLLSSSE